MSTGTEKLQSLIANNPTITEEIKNCKSVKDFLKVCASHGVNMSQAEFMKSQAQRIMQFSDAELESAHINAAFYSTDTIAGCVTWALTCTCSANPC